MEIAEIVTKKLELELEIAKIISAKISKFKDETGVSPSSIGINLVSVQTMGEVVEHSVVAGCNININL